MTLYHNYGVVYLIISQSFSLLDGGLMLLVESYSYKSLKCLPFTTLLANSVDDKLAFLFSYFS